MPTGRDTAAQMAHVCGECPNQLCHTLDSESSQIFSRV